MIKPTYGEIREFKEWLIANGYETDRDEKYFKKNENGVSLEITISSCTNGAFKQVNARIWLNFVESWYNKADIFRTIAFEPCKTLSREYVALCEAQRSEIVREVESFFFKIRGLVVSRNKEIKEINRTAMVKSKDE